MQRAAAATNNSAEPNHSCLILSPAGDKGLLTHSHLSFLKISIRLERALELTATKSQTPLPASQFRHSGAGRTSQIHVTKCPSIVSARPHSHDTFSACQPEQETVSGVQVGEMGSSPCASGKGVAHGTSPAAPPGPRGTQQGRHTAAGAGKPRSLSLSADFLCSFQRHNTLIDISYENSTGAT